MTKLEKVIKGIFEMLQRNTWKDIDKERHRFQPMLNDVLKLLKEQQAKIEKLEQANATINYLNEEKENAIKEIEECKAFNLKCDGQPKWLRKGIDVGLNTALTFSKARTVKHKC